jgi:ABC-type antimicrobial peptide transport system permease subunit
VVVLLFAAIALVLAIVGTYGMVSYSVAQRSAELGIRAALGANPTQLFGLIIRQGLIFVLAGLAGGLLLAEGLGSLLNGFLFGLTARSPVVAAGVATVVLLVSSIACVWPARRVFGLEPMAVLRE